MTTATASASPTRLWNRNFTVLWAGLAQSYVGDAFLAIGLMWLALEMTGSPAVAGTIIALEGVPKLLGPVAGTIVDRSNKRRLLIGADLLRGLLLIAVFAVHRQGLLAVWHLYAVVVLLGALEAVYGPAMQVMLPTLVPDGALPAATSILQSTLQMSLILGSSLAGVVLAAVGAPVALVLDGLTFLIAAAALSLVRFAPTLLFGRGLVVSAVLRDMLEGFRFILRGREVLALTGLAFFVNLVLSPANVVFPVFSRTVLQGGVTGYGLLAAAIAAGMLLGNGLAGAIGDRLPHVRSIALGLVGMTLTLAGLSLLRMLELALLVTVALGMSVPFIQIPLVTRLQRIVPQDYKGRVFATMGSLVKLALPLAAALAGQALSALPVGTVFRVAALGVLVVALVWIAWGTRIGGIALAEREVRG